MGNPMLEFTLSIDLGLKERLTPHPTVDRAFIARALTTAAAEILDEHRYGAAPHQTAPARDGVIADDTGEQVGSWRISIKGFRPEAA
jgi:hypothetical protein